MQVVARDMCVALPHAACGIVSVSLFPKPYHFSLSCLQLARLLRLLGF